MFSTNGDSIYHFLHNPLDRGSVCYVRFQISFVFVKLHRLILVYYLEPLSNVWLPPKHWNIMTSFSDVWVPRRHCDNIRAARLPTSEWRVNIGKTWPRFVSSDIFFYLFHTAERINEKPNVGGQSTQKEWAAIKSGSRVSSLERWERLHYSLTQKPMGPITGSSSLIAV